MPRFFQLKTFLQYWLDSVDAHSLHSPFLYDFYINVIAKESDRRRYESIEAECDAFVHDESAIEILDFGSGSISNDNAKRKVKEIAATSLSPAHLSRLYARLISYYQLKEVLELGTSLGINTVYLAREAAHVTTFEGAPLVAGIARALFERVDTSNITLVEGNIDQRLPEFLLKSRPVDFALIDANHRYEPTLNYFQHIVRRISPRGIVAIDDIHYNEGMERAWAELKTHKLVYGSADIYRVGFLFFDPSLNKQHVVLQHRLLK